MATHHGGKVGKAAKTLASRSSSKSAKSKAGKMMANHKAKQHQRVLIGAIVSLTTPETIWFLGLFGQDASMMAANQPKTLKRNPMLEKTDGSP